MSAGGKTVKPLTIGQVARRALVGIETVRFYEREGLLERAARSPSSGYRVYEEDVIARLQFIRRAKELGFTLNEIKELVSLRLDPGASCTDVKARAEAKIADIEARIATLRCMRMALLRLTQRCRQTGGVQCAILETLKGRLRLTRRKARRPVTPPSMKGDSR
jgi:MerR family transcriptional regulator, copper efflux regulator